MEQKHYKMLGDKARKYITSTMDVEPETVGKALMFLMEIILEEAQRDARDQANGKGTDDA
jgi:hypothetical protein